MICAYINGKIAYPAAQRDIKVTLLNPFIKDGDEKTMELVFPMSLPENREVFGALNRLDTGFETEDFADCRLLADNFEVINGVGTITGITEDEVKLQILAGKSYLRYKESFDSIYIDGIDYGEVLERHQRIIINVFSTLGNFNDFTSEISSQGFIGDPGRYVFMPVHDEGSDFYVNSPLYFQSTMDGQWKGVTIVRAAIQPNLMMVLHKVLETLGYRITENNYLLPPWNRLYVASGRIGLSMAKALPHWSAYKFLDEIRKLFNAVFLFDEKTKTVRILPFEQAGYTGMVSVDPADGFSSSYDKEGLEYLGSSNLTYELSDCERSEDVVSEDVRKAFEVKEYDDYGALNADFDAMATREKMTRLFHCPAGWFYGSAQADEDGNVTAYLLKECGWFSPLVRREGASSVSLNIVPVAMSHTDVKVYTGVLMGSSLGRLFMGTEWLTKGLIAHVSVDSQPTDNYITQDRATDEEYVTVQDVMENGESLPSNESDSSQLEVFFVPGLTTTVHPDELERGEMVGRFDGPLPENAVVLPVAFTEYRMAVWHAPVPPFSLSLMPSYFVTSVGDFHNKGLKVRRNINGNNEVCIKFPFDGKPDPKAIYIIRSKKFICSRIEMSVGENGIERMKTGYFYEVL